MMNARTAVSDHPGGMDDDTLAAAVATLAAHIRAATYRLLVLIAELDRRKLWADQGALSCAHWLSWACGIDAHTAREKVRVARALEDLPLLSEALSKGELGYSKVRALTRVATSDNEAYLLDIGLHGTAAHVEKFARLYRQASRANETERADARHRERGLTFWHEDDGTVVLHGRFPPEMAARILSALEAAMAAHAAEQPAAAGDQESAGGSSPDVPHGTSPAKPPVTVRRADALAWMADRVFEAGDAPALAPDRHEIVVHVDAEVLAGGGTGRCEIEGHSALAGETARRLCCDAGIVATVDGPTGEPLAVGTAYPHHSPRDAPCAAHPRPRMPLPPDAPPPTGCTDITCGTGPRAATPRSTTWFCSARSTTGWCTRGALTCTGSMTGRTASSHPTGGRSGHRRRPGPRHRRSSSATTRRSGSPSTAEPRPRAGTGLPVDYDQGIMVAMASWGPANTRAEPDAAAANGIGP